MNVYQLNCHKSVEANIHLNEFYTKSNGMFVGLCQEPGHNKGKIKFFDRSLDCHTGCDENPRACIVISRDMEALKLSQFCCQDQVAIQVKDGSRVIVLASVYMPYDSVQPPPSAVTRDLV